MLAGAGALFGIWFALYPARADVAYRRARDAVERGDTKAGIEDAFNHAFSLNPFEAFYRAGHQSVAGTHGAGLGLAVVKEVADRLLARVSVEDSVAGGARLVVAFRGVSAPVFGSALPDWSIR